MAPQEQLVSTDKIIDAIAAFRKLREVELAEAGKKSIIDESEREERFVTLQFTVKKISSCQRILMVPFVFPHCVVTEDDEVCFIVGCKESDKGNKRADHERYANEWKQKLRAMGIDREIHILPIMQLETEFKAYEAKRKLCKAFDHFICDHKIMYKMPKLLGCTFFKRRKMPIRVYMRDEANLKKNIEEAIERVLIHITPEGPNISVKVGNLQDHNDEEIAENIRSIMDQFIPEHLPGGVNNVNSMHLASFLGKSIPLYISLTSANMVDMSESDKMFAEKQTPKEIEDEIDTMPGVRVKVRTDGKVVAVKDESAKLDTDDLLDEDYLDVFRDQEFEDRDEAKKRYIKHLARKGALRKVGRRFGPNMLKLPNTAPVPKPPPRPTPKQKMPKQANPPPVPTMDALQGFDDNHGEGDDECPELVPIEGSAKKAKQRKSKASNENVFEVSNLIPDDEALQGETKKKQKKKSAAAFLSEEASFVVSPQSQTKDSKKKARKSDFAVQPQSEQNRKTISAKKIPSGMVVSKIAGETLSSTPKPKEKKSGVATPDTPRPILKTPQTGSKHEKRKSVSFSDRDCSLQLGNVKTPKDTEPTPVYIETPSPAQTAGKKRKSMTGGFDLTPYNMKDQSKKPKKAKKSVGAH